LSIEIDVKVITFLFEIGGNAGFPRPLEIRTALHKDRAPAERVNERP